MVRNLFTDAVAILNKSWSETSVAKKVSMHKNRSDKGKKENSTQERAYASKENLHIT